MMPLSDTRVVTAQDIVRNPDLLLHKRGPAQSRTQFDGRVGCAVEKGEFIVYSPNKDYIMYPPMGSDRQVRIRQDGRYADDDYLCWPQLYSEQHPHFPFIPRRPLSLDDPTVIMWLTPGANLFVLSAPDVLTGVGKLDPNLTKQFRQVVDTLKARHKKYESRKAGKSCVPFVTELDDTIARLESLPGSLRQIQFTVAHLQRRFLELTAFLDYAYTYFPIMNGSSPPSDLLAHVVGTFIPSRSMAMAQGLLRAGIPVWNIAPSMALPLIRIDAVVEPRRALQFTVEADTSPPFDAFFTGSSASLEKYKAYDQFAYKIMGLANLFETNAPSSSTPGPSASTRTDFSHTPRQSQRGKQPYHKQNPKRKAAVPPPGRNKFVDPESPLVPQQLVLWSEALMKVDQSLRPDEAQNVGYAFPDPALFVAVHTEEKTITYLKNWLQYRPACIYRVSTASSSARPLSSQTWRTFLLSASYVDVKDSSSAFHERRARIMGMLGGLDEEGVVIKLDPPDAPTFCNVPVQLTPPLKTYDIQPILWELYELNFRFELLALDARLTRDSDKSPATRQRVIKRCFEGKSLLVPEVDYAAWGLAAPKWNHRLPYVMALGKVMKSWAGCPVALTSMVEKDKSLYTEKDALDLESRLAMFYTQSFFNTFGRAAIVPHRYE